MTWRHYSKMTNLIMDEFCFILLRSYFIVYVLTYSTQPVLINKTVIES